MSNFNGSFTVFHPNNQYDSPYDIVYNKQYFHNIHPNTLTTPSDYKPNFVTSTYVQRMDNIFEPNYK